MIFFIDLLRALAMCLITNSHYVGVYPNDIIANGGLLGDVIFFAVSGFCLSNIRLPFHRWYVKRILRIYPIVWIIVLFYLAIGQYAITGWRDAVGMFVYPMPQYHFVASIIVLYIPYYIFVFCEKKASQSERLKKTDFTVAVMIAVAVIWLLVYAIFYDRSYYHIDTVREPMIRFLYFEAMLIGFYFKKHLASFENRKGILKWFVTAVLFGLYFASKLLFSKREAISQFQIANQFILLALMTGVIMCVASLSGRLEKLPAAVKKTVSFLARITLEIYVVQFVIIKAFKHFAFPVNWLVITAVILAAAVILHYVIEGIRYLFSKIRRTQSAQVNK